MWSQNGAESAFCEVRIPEVSGIAMAGMLGSWRSLFRPGVAALTGGRAGVFLRGERSASGSSFAGGLGSTNIAIIAVGLGVAGLTSYSVSGRP